MKVWGKLCFTFQGRLSLQPDQLGARFGQMAGREGGAIREIFLKKIFNSYF